MRDLGGGMFPRRAVRWRIAEPREGEAPLALHVRTAWGERLLPARDQDRLHPLGPLIDGLVPGEVGLLATCPLSPSLCDTRP
jgi:hypothetical protein